MFEQGSLKFVQRQGMGLLQFNEVLSFLMLLAILSATVNTLRTGYGDLRSYITTVEDGLRRSPFVTRALHLITQYMEPVSEWYC
jgi:hypothetical protein